MQIQIAHLHLQKTSKHWIDIWNVHLFSCHLKSKCKYNYKMWRIWCWMIFRHPKVHSLTERHLNNCFDQLSFKFSKYLHFLSSRRYFRNIFLPFSLDVWRNIHGNTGQHFSYFKIHQWHWWAPCLPKLSLAGSSQSNFVDINI